MIGKIGSTAGDLFSSHDGLGCAVAEQRAVLETTSLNFENFNHAHLRPQGHMSTSDLEAMLASDIRLKI